MKKQNRVLFISDIAATREFTAGAVLKSIIQELPQEWNIDQAIIGNPFLSYKMNTLNVGKVFFTQKPNAQWQGVFSKRLAWLFQSYVRKIEVPQVQKWLQSIINGGNYDKVVLAFQCQVLTQILTNVDFGGATRISIMWDHPSWFAREHQLSKKTSKTFLAQWFSLIQNSNVAVLPSQKARSLLGTFEGHPVVLYPHLAENIRKPSPNTSTKGVLKIGFAGSPYSNVELKAFADFLIQQKTIPGYKRIEFHVFSKNPLFKTNPFVLNRGWMTPIEVTRELANLDFAFLPYPFQSEMRPVVETSFPSKLSIYLAAGLPSLYFGPADTAAANFLDATSCGAICADADFLKALQMLISARKNMKENVSKTFSEYFSQTSFREAIAEIFELSKNDFSDRRLWASKPEVTKEIQTSNSGHIAPRVRTLSWDLIKARPSSIDFAESNGELETFEWISLSKYFYAFLRPKAAVSVIFRRLRLPHKISVGTVTTKIALKVFAILAIIYKGILLKYLQVKKPNSNFSEIKN